jgi:hypothetical protein
MAERRIDLGDKKGEKHLRELLRLLGDEQECLRALREAQLRSSAYIVSLATEREIDLARWTGRYRLVPQDRALFLEEMDSPPEQTPSEEKKGKKHAARDTSSQPATLGG